MAVEMKDSGIQWIGEIPKHWDVCRIKKVAKIILGKMLDTSKPDGESLTPYLCAKDIHFDGIDVSDLKEMYFTESEREYYAVKKGDLLVVEGGAGAGGCSILTFDLQSTCIQNSVMIVRADNVTAYNPYIAYSLEVIVKRGYIEYISNVATIPHFTKDKVGNTIIPMPPLNEQQKIAKYLDSKCGEIDELIDLETQMIDELKAYKQSIITEAVTRGLNPNVPMRDSGIEWLGEIPQHWKTTKLKYIGSARNGLTYTPTDVCDEEQGLLVLRSSNIQNGQLCFEDNVYVSKSVDSRLMMQEGDILICSRNGSASLVGKCAIIRDNLNATFGAFMMRYRSNIDKSYTLYLINTTIGQYKPMFSTSTINQLTNEMIGSMQVAIPPLQEQRAIAEYLDLKCADIDALIALRQEKIDTLKEYKKSLIFEYVTGKRQVD